MDQITHHINSQDLKIVMEDYCLPKSAVATLKSLHLSGFPEVIFTEGKDTVQLRLTWTKRQPKQVKRAESGRGATDCRRSGTSKPAPSAGKSTCQPGQSGAESRKPEPAPQKGQGSGTSKAGVSDNLTATTVSKTRHTAETSKKEAVSSTLTEPKTCSSSRADVYITSQVPSQVRACEVTREAIHQA